MTDPLTIKEQMERWVVEEDAGGGTFRKVSLWTYVERLVAETRASLLAELRAQAYGSPRAVPLAIIERILSAEDGTARDDYRPPLDVAFIESVVSGALYEYDVDRKAARYVMDELRAILRPRGAK